VRDYVAYCILLIQQASKQRYRITLHDHHPGQCVASAHVTLQRKLC
jgi:hypothetical protein